ncbi:MAG TPA: hypothetical protein VGH30_12040 [Jatrophihabitantaceae bacterium]|jgi:hypothetical protein
MRSPPLALLLGLWAVLAVVPGVIADLAFSLNADLDIGGGTFLVWIVGYLAQLGVFMAVTRRATGTNTVGWIVASVLPWVCDWTVPAARWAIAPCAAVALATAWWIQRRVSRHGDLEQHGVPATGEVLEVVKPRLMNIVINNVYIKRTLRLRVNRSDGTPPYEVRYHGTFMIGDIPDVGTRLSLRIDPKDPKHFATVDEDADAPAHEG